MVFGGYLAAGGKMAVILHALPFELMIIGGSAVGALVISNQPKVIKATIKGTLKTLKPSKFSKKDYLDLLCLMFALTRLIRTKGLIALESHIENPNESSIFTQYPKVLADHFAIDFICDTLRMISMNLEDPHQVEDHMDKQLEKHHHEALAPAHSLQSMADALPALGIVAAVLGVIKTMGSITEPPEILGGMIGGALVGTFLGVFLAYGFAGPLASRLNQIVEEEGQYYRVIQDVLIAHLHNNAPQISVEIGRGSIPSSHQPTFNEVDEAISNVSTE